MIDISIDIETLSSKTNASIVQIGAVYQLPEEAVEFFCVVDDPSGVIEPETVRWHMEVGGGINSLGTRCDAIPLRAALDIFAQYLKEAGATVDGGAALWTHATFDIPRLAEAYQRALWYGVPWHYRNCRDLRTLYDLAGGRPKIDLPKTHNALDDAKRQLREIEACRARMDGVTR